MPGFVKRYADAGLAREALRRSRWLRAQGVPTPAAEPGPLPSELVFDRLHGRSGRDLIGQDTAPLLGVVLRLHAAAVPGLPVHDPLRRIRPRLALTDVRALRDIAAGPVPQGRAVLHGDLHLGQFVVTAPERVWIVDLDDLALGPPEADLANFAAHLATTCPGDGIATWAERVVSRWQGLGQRVERSVFARSLELALLRRHLKLRAAGRPDFEAEILGYLRDRASFSIR